jgi:hypothetical protein
VRLFENKVQRRIFGPKREEAQKNSVILDDTVLCTPTVQAKEPEGGRNNI